MAFCSSCGKKISASAKFCPECGAAVEHVSGSERENTFEGKIHKCPNCGEIIKAFSTKCPTCGYEFRDTNGSSAVAEFAKRLEEIEATRKPAGKLSGLASAFGMKSSDGVDEKKENLIRNFTVPNTKEDIFEFLILASSNMDTSLFNAYGNQMSPGERQSRLNVTKAWIAKFEQTYEKAKLSFGTDPDFEKIENIHKTKNKEIKRAKLKTPIILIALIGLLIAISVGPITAISLKEASMEKKLNKTVQEIQVDIQNGNYDDALLKANTLYFDRSWSKNKADDWDRQRESIIKMIEEKKAGN